MNHAKYFLTLSFFHKALILKIGRMFSFGSK
jgi:hypothetical protein